MKTNPPTELTVTENSNAPAPAARKKVRERAVELALSHGRSAQDVLKSDWEQAKQELAGPPAAPVAVFEYEGWDPEPDSTGHHVAVPSGDGEDDEGRSEVERLVVAGVREAGREQKRAADRET